MPPLALRKTHYGLTCTLVLLTSLLTPILLLSSPFPSSPPFWASSSVSPTNPLGALACFRNPPGLPPAPHFKPAAVCPCSEKNRKSYTTAQARILRAFRVESFFYASNHLSLVRLSDILIGKLPEKRYSCLSCRQTSACLCKHSCCARVSTCRLIYGSALRHSLGKREYSSTSHVATNPHSHCSYISAQANISSRRPQTSTTRKLLAAYSQPPTTLPRSDSSRSIAEFFCHLTHTICLSLVSGTVVE